MKMRYCVRCLYNEFKPDIWFDENGLCAACVAFDSRKDIDWNSRETQFKELVSRHIQLNKSNDYDCIIPVSGGKDSYYQTIKSLEYGLRPLLVTATTDSLSELGRRNLDNLSTLEGVDAIEVTVNKSLRRKLAKYTLQKIGDISWAEHITIFTIPIQEALRRNIKLVIWGENPQHEYGGPKNDQNSLEMSADWLPEFGGLNGFRVSDAIDTGITSRRNFSLYRYPDHTSVENNIQQVFLGQYFPWDGAENAHIAESNGFEVYYPGVEGSGYDYENLDNYFTGIHDYLKYLKFGFGRATDICSNHIRRERLDRTTAIRHIRKWDGAYPSTYLGRSLEDILSEINMSIEDFQKVCVRFANKRLFDVVLNSDGLIINPKFNVE